MLTVRSFSSGMADDVVVGSRRQPSSSTAKPEKMTVRRGSKPAPGPSKLEEGRHARTVVGGARPLELRVVVSADDDHLVRVAGKLAEHVRGHLLDVASRGARRAARTGPGRHQAQEPPRGQRFDVTPGKGRIATFPGRLEADRIEGDGKVADQAVRRLADVDERRHALVRQLRCDQPRVVGVGDCDAAGEVEASPARPPRHPRAGTRRGTRPRPRTTASAVYWSGAQGTSTSRPRGPTQDDRSGS